jgi:S-adenosylmethionine decarboxylase
MNDIGKHLLADLYGIDPTLLADERVLMSLLRSGLAYAYFTVIDQLSYTFPGPGAGVTGIYMLSESHAAFHTYPEICYMALDVFSCGASEPKEVLAYMRNALRPQAVTISMERRGKNMRTAMALSGPLPALTKAH